MSVTSTKLEFEFTLIVFLTDPTWIYKEAVNGDESKLLPLLGVRTRTRCKIMDIYNVVKCNKNI